MSSCNSGAGRYASEKVEEGPERYELLERLPQWLRLVLQDAPYDFSVLSVARDYLSMREQGITDAQIRAFVGQWLRGYVIECARATYGPTHPQARAA